MTTVLVQILEQYSIMTHNIVENRQEKEVDMEQNIETLSVEIDDKDTIIRNLIENSAVKISKNQKYIQHLKREFKEELEKLQNEGNNWKQKCYDK